MHYGDYDGISDKVLIVALLCGVIMGLAGLTSFVWSIAWAVHHYH